MNTAKVAIVGFGTIGSGVARLLLEYGDRIARHAGQRLELVQVVDPDLTRTRNVTLPPGLLTNDLSKVLDNPEIAAVVQAHRRHGAGPDHHVEGAGKRQGRGHCQQGPVGRARRRNCSPGPRNWAVRSPSRRPWPAAFPSSPPSANR